MDEKNKEVRTVIATSIRVPSDFLAQIQDLSETIGSPKPPPILEYFTPSSQNSNHPQ